jgi:hypothetical protein
MSTFLIVLRRTLILDLILDSILPGSVAKAAGDEATAICRTLAPGQGSPGVFSP